MKHFLYILFLFLVPVSVYGADLSGDSLTGKWNFSHMILDVNHFGADMFFEKQP